MYTNFVITGYTKEKIFPLYRDFLEFFFIHTKDITVELKEEKPLFIVSILHLEFLMDEDDEHTKNDRELNNCFPQ